MSSSPFPERSDRFRLDLRLPPPGQLAVVGAVLWVLSLLVHAAALLGTLGIVLLVVAAVGYLIRPRSRTVYWRGRPMELEDEPTAAHRLYRLLFRR